MAGGSLAERGEPDQPNLIFRNEVLTALSKSFMSALMRTVRSPATSVEISLRMRAEWHNERCYQAAPNRSYQTQPHTQVGCVGERRRNLSVSGVLGPSQVNPSTPADPR